MLEELDKKLSKIEETFDLQEKQKKKPYSSKTYTTGDPDYNIAHFNKNLGNDGKLNNMSWQKEANKAAEKAAETVGTFVSASPDGASSISTGGESTGGEGGGMGESLITESGGKKGRKVTRYFIKPQNIWCAKKTDIINALIDSEDNDCTVYTLNNLSDNKDVTKLTPKDVIYYYEDGILYDKNHVKIMDYDLYVKNEEERKKLDVNHASDAEIEKVYADRLIGESLTEANDEKTVCPNCNKEVCECNKQAIKEEHELDLAFDDAELNSKYMSEAYEDKICCICGEEIEGYGNNPYPVKDEGRCCDACNLKFVIPARLQNMNY